MMRGCASHRYHYAACTRAIVLILTWLACGCEPVVATLGAETARHAGTSQGFQSRSFTDNAGNKRGYVLFVPHGYRPGAKLPVLMFLGGLGEYGDDGVKQISNNFGVQVWEMRQTFPFLAVAPQCRREGSWSAGSQDTTWALEILDAVIEEFGADKDRVFLTGVSSGGNGVWNLAAAYPERFAGIVPLCGEGGADPQRLADARLPVWAFYNELDGAHVVNFNRAARKRLIELGQSPLVTEYHELGHDCWNRAYRSTAMYAWLLAQNRSQNRATKKAEPRFEYWPGERLVREWRQEGGGEWRVDAEGVLTGRLEDDHGQVGKPTPRPFSRKAQPSATQVGGERRTEEDGGSKIEDRTDDEAVRSTQYAVQSTEQDDSEQDIDEPGVGEPGGVSPRMGPRGLLVSTATGQNIEIHADIWLEANSEVRLGVVGTVAAEDDAEGEASPAVPAGPAPSDLFVSIVLPDLGAGGLVTGDGWWLARLDASAQRTLRTNAWNDVRVRLAKGRLSVQLNGWAACDAELNSVTNAEEFRCALVTPNDGSQGRWQFVRTRVLAFSREAQPSATQIQDEQSTEQQHEDDADEQDKKRSGQVGKPTLRGILAGWATRESHLASGEFEWVVIKRNQSETFGAVADSDGAAANDAKNGLRESIRIIFDQRGFRLEGESVPSVGMSQRAAAAASGSSGAAADSAQFQAALRNRFLEAGVHRPENVTLLPYLVLVDAVRELHVWERKGESYPRAIVLAPGTAHSALGADSFSSVPMYSGIVEAFQMAVRPLHSARLPHESLAAGGVAEPAGVGVSEDLNSGEFSHNRSAGDLQGAERFRILPDRPVVDGEPCVVVEERLGENWEGRTRRLWVDPSRGNVVVRCLHTVQDKLDGAQYDIEYDRDEAGLWLPRTISVLRMSSLGDPQDAMTIVRRSAQAAPFSREAQPSATGARSEESTQYGVPSTEHKDGERSGGHRPGAPGWSPPVGLHGLPTSNAAAQSPDSTDSFAWVPAPGTWVDDYTENKQYFVRADGSRRNISFSENYAGLSYADLLAEGSAGWAGLGVVPLRFWSAFTAITKRAITWPGILVTLPAVYFLWKGARGGYNRWRRTGF